MTDYEYPPGSAEALDNGCECPVLDNPYMGVEGCYVTSLDCPLHGWDEYDDD